MNIKTSNQWGHLIFLGNFAVVVYTHPDTPPVPRPMGATCGRIAPEITRGN